MNTKSENKLLMFFGISSSKYGKKYNMSKTHCQTCHKLGFCSYVTKPQVKENKRQTATTIIHMIHLCNKYQTDVICIFWYPITKWLHIQ